jgi:inner membrane protein
MAAVLGSAHMDNLTHGTLGIIAALLTAPPELRRKAALAGFIAAELPDADVFIISPADPLFGLQMHRHFTHSLVMIPFLAVLGVVLANALRRVFRRSAVWRGLWLPAAAAAATHGLCDTWTSYGTHLLWPFTERRESWDLISVIDPLMTLPLAVLAVLAWRRASAVLASCGAVWVCVYLSCCVIQQHRARVAVDAFAAEMGHEARRLTVKPSFGNIMVWRGLYLHGGDCHVVCVRPGLSGGVALLGTVRAPLLEMDKLPPPLDKVPPGSVLAQDIGRFSHFSDGWLGLHPEHPHVIGDLRYATRPDQISPLWGIATDPARTDRHVKFETFRRTGGTSWGALWRMVTGQGE